MRDRASEPRISVVIPMFDKRVEEEECLESWCRKQSLPRENYEVLVTSNGTNLEADGRVRNYLSAPDRLVEVPEANMAGLYHAGAVEAQAPILFFTELHCVAEKQCLEKLLEFLDRNPDLAGACIHTYGDHTNSFSTTESTLFERMFDDWTQSCSPVRVFVRGV
ncbi:MAG: glycosyltransferase, partial [Verrucomicrobiota bacterium]